MRTLWMLGVVGMVGCGETGPTSEDLDAIATAAASDVAEIGVTVDELAAALTARAAMVDLGGTFPGVGDCAWDWTLSGPPGALDYAAGLAVAPCGGGYSGRLLDLDYAVTAGALAGTVTKGTSTWSYDITGSRASAVTIDTARRDPATYTADWTLDSLTGETDGFTAGPFDATLTYTGFAGNEWQVTVSRAADLTLTGTITGPNGATCTISGTADDAEVTCDGAATTTP